MSPEELYLDLMKRSLLGFLIQDVPSLSFRNVLAPDLAPKAFDPEIRAEGKDWPSLALSMIGQKRMDNLHRSVETVLADGVPGDLIETGVWRGGATIFMRAVLKVRGVTDRVVWVADSFLGCPPPDVAKYPADAGLNLDQCADVLAISADVVRENFRRYGLLDDQVRFLEGWFKDTLPGAPIDSLAVLRLDGDLYESTIDALNHLYPKLSVGGFAIVDDYHIPACARAVHDYRLQHGIREPITPIDDHSAFWRRTRGSR